MSVPGNSCGSVIGNALDRGIGYTPYGDHCEQICGMEVVLPDGDIVRTGMGAQEGSRGWQHYKYGYGPGWDQMFFQSNFGIVTKAGVWLQPEPEMTAKIELAFPHFDDAAWAIDILADLRRRDVIQHNIVFGSPVRAASTMSQRADWYEGEGAIPDSVSEEMMKKLGLGWWNAKINLYGHEGVVTAQVALIRKLFEPRLGKKLDFQFWRKGEPLEKSAQGVPTTMGLQCVNWYGGRGGHIGFSPIIPQDGDLALAQFRRDPPPALLVSPGDATDAVRAAILVKAITPELQKRAKVYAAEAGEIARQRRLAAVASEALFTSDSELAERRERLEATPPGAAPVESGPITPPIRLLAPAKGKLIQRYGAPLTGGGEASGVTFAADHGASVAAPDAGLVQFVGPVKGWGTILILRLAGGYHLVLAGLDRTSVGVGQSVAAGAPVGWMTDGRNSPSELYLEVRERGVPVDPARWLDGLS